MSLASAVGYNVYTAPGWRENPQLAYYGGGQTAGAANMSGLGGIAGDYRNAAGQSWGNQMDARGAQQAALSQANGLMNGTGQSLAYQQIQQGAAAANQNALSRAASARGGGPALAAMQMAAANAQGQNASGANQAYQMARAQEYAGAMNLAGQLSGQMYRGDLAAQQMAQAGMLDYETMRQRQAQLELDARLRQGGLLAGAWQAGVAQDAADARAEAARRGAIFGAGLGAAGAVGGFFAGGPAGAGAGFSAGNAAGNALGGT